MVLKFYLNQKNIKNYIGFTIIEILFGTVFLIMALLFFLTLFSTSNRGTLDAYQETIAFSLANETMEWVSALGFGVLREVIKSPVPLALSNIRSRLEKIGLNSFQGVEDLELDDGSISRYPEDFKKFERRVEIVQHGADLILVRVTVQNKFAMLFRKGAVILEKYVSSEN